MSKLTSYAERLKLAHLMKVSPESLTFMDRLPADAIGGLRKQISNTLFDSNHAMFQRVAASSRLLPVPLLTIIAQKAVGPWLSAHLAGHMPTDRAIDMSKRLPVNFLADVCVGIDPRRVKHIIQGIPVDLSLQVALELVRRRDFITMGRFIDALPDSTLVSLLRGMHDDEALLMIAFYVEDRGHLDHVIGLIPDERIDRVIEVAHRKELWPQALALMRFVSPASCRRLGDIACTHSEEALDSMLEAADRYDLLGELLPIMSFMSDKARRRFINLPRTADINLLQNIVTIAREQSLWAELLPLLRLKDDGHELAIVVGSMGEATLREVMLAASEHDLWPDVLDQVQFYDEERQAALALALARSGDNILQSLMRAVQQHDRWQQLIDIATGMSPETQQYLVENGVAQENDIATRLVRAAETAGIWEDALQVLTARTDALVQLMEKTPIALQQQLLQEAMDIDSDVLERLITAAGNSGAWEALLRVFAASPVTTREKVSLLLGTFPAEKQTELRQRAQSLGLADLLG